MPNNFPYVGFRRIVNLMFGKYILATNIVSSGVLMAVGDKIEQEIEYRKKKKQVETDYARLGRMFTVGLIEGPIHHIYYVTFLNRILPRSDLKSVQKKIVLDQLIASPLFIVTFFYSMGLLERKSLRECKTQFINSFSEIYLVDWLVWPPVQFVNFYFLPAAYQVVFINCVTMLYNTFLSYVKHKAINSIEDTYDRTKKVNVNGKAQLASKR